VEWFLIHDGTDPLIPQTAGQAHK